MTRGEHWLPERAICPPIVFRCEECGGEISDAQAEASQFVTGRDLCWADLQREIDKQREEAGW